MADLVYTNKEHIDQGVLQAFTLDAAWGVDENNFEIVLPSDVSLDFGSLVFIDGTQLGGVVDKKKPDATGDVATVTYVGRTWHGILACSIVSPDAGSNYLTYSGDANEVIRTIIARQGLGDIFICEGNSGITVNGRFDRYTDAYSGLMKMLWRDSKTAARLAFYKDPNGKCHVEAVEASRFTDDVDSDRYGFKSIIDGRPYNHLVCLGEGDLKDRDVIHLYADENGNVSQTQTLFGIDEKTTTYDYSNCEHDELLAKGIERLEELQQTSGVEMVLLEDEGSFEVGDIVGAYDNMTGLYAESNVTKVIVNVDEFGIMTYSYEVGDISTVNSDTGSGGGVSMSTLNAGFVKKPGDTMTGNLIVNRGSVGTSRIHTHNAAGYIGTFAQASNTGSVGLVVGNASGTESNLIVANQDRQISTIAPIVGTLNLKNTSSSLIFNNTNVTTNGTAPSSTTYNGMLFNSNTGARIAYSEAMVNTSGASQISLVASNDSQKASGASAVTNGIWLYVNKDGTRGVTLSDDGAPMRAALHTPVFNFSTSGGVNSFDITFSVNTRCAILMVGTLNTASHHVYRLNVDYPGGGTYQRDPTATLVSGNACVSSVSYVGGKLRVTLSGTAYGGEAFIVGGGSNVQITAVTKVS